MRSRIFFLLFTSIFCGFYSVSQGQNAGNYADTLIRVGNVTVCTPFFKRDIRNYVSSTHLGKIDSSAIAAWYHRYLDDILLTNCAMDKGVLKRADVEESVMGFANYVLVQKGSPFYQANINSNIKVSAAELYEAYRSMSTLVHFSMIRFSSQALYLSALKGRDPSPSVFEELKNIRNDSIEYSANNQLIGPSLQFWPLQYQIASLKVGEISKPVKARKDEFSDAIYVIRVDSVRSVSKQTFNLERSRLEMILSQIKEDSLYNRYERAILQKAGVQLAVKNISDHLMQSLIEHSTNPKDIYFTPYLTYVLMTYSLNGTPVTVSLDRFLRYYRNLPVRLNLQTRADVVHFLYYYVLSSYMVQDASLANFDKEPRFVSLKKDLRNKFGRQTFEEGLFENSFVSEEESRAFYSSHNHDFNGSASATVTLLMFNSEMDAITTAKKIENLDRSSWEEKIKDKSLFPQIQSYFSNVTLQYSDSLQYPMSSVRQILDARDNTFCGPFFINNQVVLAYKKNTLTYRTKTYEESKDQIYAAIKERKCKEAKENLLKQAYQRYPFYRVPSFQDVWKIYNSIY